MINRRKDRFATKRLKAVVATILFVGMGSVECLSGVHLGLGNAAAKRAAKIVEKTALPACTAAAPYTVSPIPTNKLLAIVPLGNINPGGGHIFPTSHNYFEINKDPIDETVPLFAMADVRVLHVASSLFLNDDPPTTDYSITVSPCREIVTVFGHIQSLAPILENKIASSPARCHEYTTGIYHIRRCEHALELDVKAGEMLGTAGGVMLGMDVGTLDLRRPLSYVNPSRYYGEGLFGACTPDYFSLDLRAFFYGFFGDSWGVEKRTIEPLCGEINQDKAGTAQGNWFKIGAPNNPEDPHLALIHDNIDPTQAVFSVGTSLTGSAFYFHFTPISSGLVNRDFGDVTSDGQVYCYTDPPLFLQLLTPNIIRLEIKENLACNTPPYVFTGSYVEFER